MKECPTIPKPDAGFIRRFKENHPNLLVDQPQPSTGVFGVGSLVEVWMDDWWQDGIIDKILYAPENKILTFFVQIGYGENISVPHHIARKSNRKLEKHLRFHDQEEGKYG